jgi:hypothetical protein
VVEVVVLFQMQMLLVLMEVLEEEEEPTLQVHILLEQVEQTPLLLIQFKVITEVQEVLEEVREGEVEVRLRTVLMLEPALEVTVEMVFLMIF